jgi:uracil-DNA glycosylase
VDRETFYDHPAIGFAGMAFCYPGTVPGGGDFPPPARCAALWRPRLLDALPKVELTVLLGRPAQTWALGDRDKGSMDTTVHAWRDYLPTVLVMPHPSWRNGAWLARNPWFEREVTPYLQARVAAMVAS